MLTGESRAVAKAPGDKVYAGTVNQDGMLVAVATGVGSRTLLAGIVRLVAEAQGSKAPIQRLADRVVGRVRAGRRRDRGGHVRRDVVASPARRRAR